MNPIWLAAPAAVAVIGVIGLIMALTNLFRGRFTSAAGGVMGGGLLTAIGLAGALLGLNLQTYQRLTYERPVAQVTVAAVDPAQKLYNVTVERLDGGQTQTCPVQGDEFMLSARVQKWKPWANVVGLDSTYTFDQLSNKYFDAAEANGQDITACDVDSTVNKVADVVPRSLLDQALAMAQIEDRKFGSAIYMPMRDGAVYDVLMTQDALNAEPANDVAKRANNAVPSP